MEGLFFILVGAALFSQAWYVLGLYSEGRTMGVFVGGLGVLLLAALVTAESMFDPMMITGEGKAIVLAENHLAELTMMKTVIVLWALYAIGVGAHGLFDFDDRAIGFYSAILAVATLFSFIYFAVELEGRYGEGTWLAISGGTLILTILAGMMFFALSFAFSALRVVSGWFLLIGGSAVAAIGLLVVSTVIT